MRTAGTSQPGRFGNTTMNTSEALIEPISTGDQAGGGAINGAPVTALASREDPAGPPRTLSVVPDPRPEPPRTLVELPDLDAPVSAREISEATGISARGVRDNASRNKYGPRLVEGSNIFALAALPEDVRAKVLARRKTANRETVRAVVAPSAMAPVFDPPLNHFTDAEQSVGQQRADFVLEVELMVRNQPILTKPDAVDRILRREMAMERAGRARELKYPDLLTGGKKAGIALNIFNYNKWYQRWKSWRRGDGDRSNWWCLCNRYRGHERPRFGDDRFWRKFAALYEKETLRDLHNSWMDARAFCIAAGISELSIPSEDQVRRFYATKVDRVALMEKRMGPKFSYDKIDHYTPRDWSKVEPDQCWTGDHHEFNLFCRWWDPMAGPIDDTTHMPKGGWKRCRPMYTQWMDAKSWKTVGHMFSRVPSRDTIEIALRRAIEARGGVPESLYFDCGKDYKSFGPDGKAWGGAHRLGYDDDRAASICEALGIRAIMALPYNPRAKLNENFFRHHEPFVKRWPSYCGRNKPHMDRLWKMRSGTDNLTLAERCEVYPESHSFAKCLVRPEALPTVEHFEREYLHWLEEVYNKRISKGIVNFGMSPDERYLRTTSRIRKVASEEISLAFLEVYGTRKVSSGGMLYWCPPNGQKPDWKWYQSNTLKSYIGAHVQMRVDKRYMPSPRLFVFEQVTATVHGQPMKTWKQIVCDGPLGCVPNTTGVEALSADTEHYRESGRKRAAWRRQVRAGEDAKNRMETAREMEESIHIERVPGTPGRQPDGGYALAPTPRAFVPQTELKRQQDERAKAVEAARKAVPENLAKAYRGLDEDES